MVKYCVHYGASLRFIKIRIKDVLEITSNDFFFDQSITDAGTSEGRSIK